MKSPILSTASAILFRLLRKPADERSASEATDATAQTVLIVDDESDVRLILARYLQGMGFLPREANDGDAALELLRNESFDFVITDLKMPRLTGEELLLHAHELPHLRATKFVVITGGLLEDYSPEKRRVIETRADAILQKPFTKESLARSLATLGGIARPHSAPRA